MAKSLIIITGPTAIGKTHAAIETALHFQTEIVSADSRQIYRELSIGTAVPSSEERAAVPHHFIHSHSVHDSYNASRYETEAIALLETLFKKYNTVVMTGGSMLYIDAVCKGIDVMPDADPELRKHLKEKLETEGIESLRRQLRKLDPEYYAGADLKNPARIIHALEISLLTGRPYSSFRSSRTKQRPFTIIKTGLNCDRSEIHRRINRRVDSMIANGLEEEARKVFPLKHLNALNTVGYREFFSFFGGDITKEKAIDLIKRNTRRYARKQLTWFRKDPDIHWFRPEEVTEIIRLAKENGAT